jgi:sulfite oxidase
LYYYDDYNTTTTKTKTYCHGSSVEENETKGRRSTTLLDYWNQFVTSQKKKKNDGDDTTLPIYTLEEVAKHDGRSKGNDDTTWMSYGGLVYDVTSFVKYHPGGTSRILRAAGLPVEPFWILHQQHYGTDDVMKILQPLVVGRLSENDQQAVMDQVEEIQSQQDQARLTVDMMGDTIKLSLHDIQTKLPKTDNIQGQVGCTQNSDIRPVSSSLFGGVLMKDLLSHIQKQQQSKTNNTTTMIQFTFLAMDGETVVLEYPANDLSYNNILLCYEMDGLPLTKQRGYPLRIIVPQKRPIKWVHTIQIKVLETS